MLNFCKDIGHCKPFYNNYVCYYFKLAEEPYANRQELPQQTEKSAKLQQTQQSARQSQQSTGKLNLYTYICLSMADPIINLETWHTNKPHS